MALSGLPFDMQLSRSCDDREMAFVFVAIAYAPSIEPMTPKLCAWRRRRRNVEEECGEGGEERRRRRRVQEEEKSAGGEEEHRRRRRA